MSRDPLSDLRIRSIHHEAMAEVLEYERIAEEFDFEPYGTAEEEAASYNRHLATSRRLMAERIIELKTSINSLRLEK